MKPWRKNNSPVSNFRGSIPALAGKGMAKPFWPRIWPAGSGRNNWEEEE